MMVKLLLEYRSIIGSYEKKFNQVLLDFFSYTVKINSHVLGSLIENRLVAILIVEALSQ